MVIAQEYVEAECIFSETSGRIWKMEFKSQFQRDVSCGICWKILDIVWQEGKL